MPAHHTEVDEAEEEASSSSCWLRRRVSSPMRTTKLPASRCSDGAGRARRLGPSSSRPVEGSEFVVECDQIITAIGQFPKLTATARGKASTHPVKTIAVDERTFQTDDRAYSPAATWCLARRPSSRPSRKARSRLEHDAFFRASRCRMSPAAWPSSSRRRSSPRSRQGRPRPAHFAHGRAAADVCRMTTTSPSPVAAEMPKLSPASARPISSRSSWLQRRRGRAWRRALSRLLLPPNGKCDSAALTA